MATVAFRGLTFPLHVRPVAVYVGGSSLDGTIANLSDRRLDRHLHRAASIPSKDAALFVSMQLDLPLALDTAQCSLTTGSARISVTSEDENPQAVDRDKSAASQATAGPTPGGYEPRFANRGVLANGQQRPPSGDNVTYRPSPALRASGAYGDLTNWSLAARALSFITFGLRRKIALAIEQASGSPALVRIGVCVLVLQYQAVKP